MHKIACPSGLFLGKIFKSIGHAFHSLFKAVGSVFKNPYVRLAIGIAAGFYGGIGFAQALGYTTGQVAFHVAAGIAGGFIGGAIIGGNLESAFMGAFTGGVFGAIGGYAQAGQWGLTRQVAAHALAGGTTARIQGGSFQSGLLSAGFAQWSSPLVDQITLTSQFLSRVGRSMTAAAIGGAASVIGGGKFANGAVTAAFARTFNDEVEINYKEILDRGVNIKSNAELAQSMSFSDFLAINAPGGGWDFKSLQLMSGINPAILEEFGNFHFGAMAAARGYSLGFTLVGAGTVQTFVQDMTPLLGGTLRLWSPAPVFLSNSVNRSLVGFGYPYGDNFGDSKKIMSGYDYYNNSLGGR